MIMQCGKFRTDMHTGHQEITKETAGPTKVELRAKQRATQGLGWWCCYVCLGLRGTSLKGKTVEGRDGELRENNLAERGELKDDE